MSDYGTMQARIADELARTDLTTQIQRAIQSAIKIYERERFYFNEATATFSTVANQEYYGTSDLADIATLVEIDAVKLTVNGRSYPLVERDFAYLDAVSTTASYTGDPSDYAYFKLQIRLYPIPNAARTITLAYIKRFTTLSASGDTNAWMTDGEEMVRMRAKADLFVNVIRSPEEAALCHEGELIAYTALTNETTRRITSGSLRPTAF